MAPVPLLGKPSLCGQPEVPRVDGARSPWALGTRRSGKVHTGRASLSHVACLPAPASLCFPPAGLTLTSATSWHQGLPWTLPAASWTGILRPLGLATPVDSSVGSW